MWPNLPYDSLERKGTDRVVFAGMLTGRPEEEMPGSLGDLLQRAFVIARASSAGHAECCQGHMAIRLPSRKYGGACTAIQGSAAAFPIMEDIGLREGAREAWAMVKTRYTKLDPHHMARVGPLGSDGKEIPVSLVYDQVKVATKYSQQDCKSFVMADLFASTSGLDSPECIRIPAQLCKNRGTRGN